jgi:hypothetical protein
MIPRLLALPVLAAIAALAAVSPTAAYAKTGPGGTSAITGYDVSYPQCSARLPKSGSFGVVGVNDGIAWSTNPCLAGEYGWAAGRPQAPAFYMNTANPGPVSTHWNLGGPMACVDPTSASDSGCAYDYGWNAAVYAFSVASRAVSASAAAAHGWWSDVEIANSWNGNAQANAADVQGGIDYLHAQGVANVGIYSTGYQWGQIAGTAQVAGAPDWVAGAGSLTQATHFCSPAYSFSGGSVRLVQYPNGSFDGDVRCP